MSQPSTIYNFGETAVSFTMQSPKDVSVSVIGKHAGTTLEPHHDGYANAMWVNDLVLRVTNHNNVIMIKFTNNRGELHNCVGPSVIIVTATYCTVAWHLDGKLRGKKTVPFHI